MSADSIAQRALDQGKGIVRLAPTWVPRSFCVPGRRIKLHPADYYAYGGERGGIDERWFASTTPADNGPKTSPNEGLSFIVVEDAPTSAGGGRGNAGSGRVDRVTLRDAVAELKGAIVGDRIWNAHHRWPMYSKSSTTRVPSLTTSTTGISTQSWWASSASRSPTTSPCRTTTTAPTTVHVLRPAARHHAGAGPQVPCRFREGGQQDHRPLPGLSPGAGHRLGRARGHPPRAGEPVHL